MGCDDTMKFFETTLEIDASSLPSFITSCVNIIVVAPFRLTQEVSKKIMYLKHNELESVLFSAALIAFGITGVNSIIAVVKGNFTLLGGTFPIIIQLIAAILLTVLFAVFNSLDSLLFNTFESTAIKECKAIKNVKEDEPLRDSLSKEESTNGDVNSIVNSGSTTIAEETTEDVIPETLENVVESQVSTSQTEMVDIDNLLDGIGLEELALNIGNEQSLDKASESGVTASSVNQQILNAMNLSRSVIAENDTYLPPSSNINLDKSVIEHVNETESIVQELASLGSKCIAYSDAELEALQNRIKAIQPEASYFNSEFMAKFALSDDEDEEVTLMAPIPELEEDSVLL